MKQGDSRGHRADERVRLSALDAAFLYLERPSQAFHIGCIAILEQSPSLEELRDSVGARLASLRRFRQIPARARFDLAWPTWQDDPRFDLRQHVRCVALPRPGNREELEDVVETLYSTPLAPDRPLWEIHLIEGLEDGRAALLCKVHHCMSDGISGFKVLEHLADDADDRAIECEARSVADLAEARRKHAAPVARGPLAALLRALEDPAESLRKRARDLASAAGTLARFVEEPASPAPFNGRLGRARRVTWRSFPFESLGSLRTAAACTINDAALAVVSGALRRHLEQQDSRGADRLIRAVVPTSLRPTDEDGRGSREDLELGNQVTAVFPRLPVHIADPIVRLQRVREEMRRLKEGGQAGGTSLVLALAGALPSATEASILHAVPDWPLVNTLCTNVPGPKRRLRLAGQEVLDIHPIAPLFLNVGLAFAVASYADRISISAIADPGLVRDLGAIGDGIADSLHETRVALWERSQALVAVSRFAAASAHEPRRPRDPIAFGLVAGEPSARWGAERAGV
jgi:diacylglycerol O-acyltransferase / wax synthase